MAVEKCEKNTKKLSNARKTQENCCILHYALGKNASLLRFSRVFACVLAHKPYPNATPTYSVIWALGMVTTERHDFVIVTVTS